ncbi:MAG: hypothetical protein KDN22_03785 [Verrucomicrobiae bacterium]|nr:hypothetical protein [Verrucomicrobiae bacterium]
MSAAKSKRTQYKHAKPKLLGAIDQRRPKRGEAEIMGRKEFGSLKNIDIARMNAGLEIAGSNPIEDGELGHSTRVLVQATLPHGPPPKDQELWIRRNGFATLTVQSGFKIDTKTGEKQLVGLPYGTLPRLIMLYLCSEAKRLKTPEISLGDNLNDFMKELGLNRTGGDRGDITRLKTQAERLVQSRMQYQWDDGKTSAGFSASIAKKWLFFWDQQSPNQPSLFQNTVTLSADFYQEIIEHPIPLHLGAIQALKGSSFDLDLYTWLNYRVATLRKPAVIRWSALQQQLGADYSDTKDFAKNARKRLVNVQAVWQGLECEIVRGGFRLKPCEPSVPKLLKKPH